MLNEAIGKHAKNYEFDIDFVNKILDCFYVDDLTVGESDFFKVLDFFKEIKTEILDGYFHSGKWRTNDKKIISENTSNSLQPEKILVILWEEVDEMLVFDFSEICETYKLSILQNEMYLKTLQCFMILLAFCSLSLLI